MRLPRAAGHALVCLAALAGCRPAAPGHGCATPKTLVIAVASPYLEAVVRDLLAEPAIVPLAGPGGCPGHFDLRPSQVEQLVAATVFVRFDFQDSLDARLGGRPDRRPQIIPVSVPGGLCDPRTYEAACRQVADALANCGILSPEQARIRLAGISARMKALLAWTASQVKSAGLAQMPVVASRHQEAFCRLLGLNVVATLTSAEAAQPSTLDDAASAGRHFGVKWIIANRPEGRRLADAVADRLGATVLVFDNFPPSGRTEAFDELVRANVRALVEGARP